jgi:hypothetical protein
MTAGVQMLWAVWEAGSWGRGLFWNPDEGKHPLLEAATKQRVVKTEKTLCVL